MHFKTSLVTNSDNIKYKTQKPCNENQSLKSTDLRQTQRFIESWSISTALVPYSLRFSQVHWYYNSNIISKLYCTYRNHVAIPRKKETHTQTHTHTHTHKTTTAKQTKTATTYIHILAPVTSQVEMLSGSCSEWSTDRAYITCPTVTIVKWCHTAMQTVFQHQEGGRRTNT